MLPYVCMYFFPFFRNRTDTKKKALTLKQLIFMLLLVGVIGFFTLIIIMAKLGRASAETDPNLDPMLNPNIRVGNMWWIHFLLKLYMDSACNLTLLIKYYLKKLKKACSSGIWINVEIYLFGLWEESVTWWSTIKNIKIEMKKLLKSQI